MYRHFAILLEILHRAIRVKNSFICDMMYGMNSEVKKQVEKTTILLAASILLVITNLNAYFLMRHDKRCAQKGNWRVSEAKLFLAAACFGGLGGVLAMQFLRHKTKHWRFQVFFPLILILQIVVLGFGIYWLYQ